MTENNINPAADRPGENTEPVPNYPTVEGASVDEVIDAGRRDILLRAPLIGAAAAAAIVAACSPDQERSTVVPEPAPGPETQTPAPSTDEARAKSPEALTHAEALLRDFNLLIGAALKHTGTDYAVRPTDQDSDYTDSAGRHNGQSIIYGSNMGIKIDDVDPATLRKPVIYTELRAGSGQGLTVYANKGNHNYLELQATFIVDPANELRKVAETPGRVPTDVDFNVAYLGPKAGTQDTVHLETLTWRQIINGSEVSGGIRVERDLNGDVTMVNLVPLSKSPIKDPAASIVFQLNAFEDTLNKINFPD